MPENHEKSFQLTSSNVLSNKPKISGFISRDKETVTLEKLEMNISHVRLKKDKQLIKLNKVNIVYAD